MQYCHDCSSCPSDQTQKNIEWCYLVPECHFFWLLLISQNKNLVIASSQSEILWWKLERVVNFFLFQPCIIQIKELVVWHKDRDLRYFVSVNSKQIILVVFKNKKFLACVVHCSWRCKFIWIEVLSNCFGCNYGICIAHNLFWNSVIGFTVGVIIIQKTSCVVTVIQWVRISAEILVAKEIL